MTILAELGGGAVILTLVAKGAHYLYTLYVARKTVADQRLDADLAAKRVKDQADAEAKRVKDQADADAKRAQDQADADAKRSLAAMASQTLVTTLTTQLERADKRAEDESKSKSELARAMVLTSESMRQLGDVATQHSSADREDHRRISEAVADLRGDLTALHRAFEVFVARLDGASNMRSPTGEHPIPPPGKPPGSSP